MWENIGCPSPASQEQEADQNPNEESDHNPNEEDDEQETNNTEPPCSGWVFCFTPD